MGSWEFRATSSGWVARLDAAERAAVLDVVDDVLELLRGEDAAGAQAPFGADTRFGEDPSRGADAPYGAGVSFGGGVPFGPEVPGASWPAVGMDAEPLAAPSDPALRRLLPDASRGAPEVAAEFRRLTEGELRGTKAGNLSVLRALLVDGPDLRVDPASAPAVAAALTDLRLVLAERLGIRSEADADAAYRLVVEGGPLDVTDPDGVARRFLATVSTLLGVLQESLVGLLLEGLPGEDGEGTRDVVGEDDGGRASGDGGRAAGDVGLRD